jgi:hypothetical protein
MFLDFVKLHDVLVMFRKVQFKAIDTVKNQVRLDGGGKGNAELVRNRRLGRCFVVGMM